MDAKITKQRLANFISYDWLKIALSVAAAVVALVVFFTTLKTRPRADQSFEVYGYYGLHWGTDGYTFSSTALRKNVFSYDVLEVVPEVFDNTRPYGGSVYTARRMSKEGEVLFLAPVPVDSGRKDAEGNPISSTQTEEYVRSCLVGAGTEGESLGTILPFDGFMRDCAAYLQTVFGEEWRTNGEPDGEVVRQIFLDRNGKDKRFRTAAKKEEGVAQEKDRLTEVRRSYLAVEEAIGEGVFSLASFTSDSGKTYNFGLNVGGEESDVSGLPLFKNFLYYTAEPGEGEEGGGHTAKDVTLTVFDNGGAATDLRYDVFLFLDWMLRTYRGS